jgi:hypothetical protein
LVLHGKMYISNDDAARRKATALEARVYLPMRVCVYVMITQQHTGNSYHLFIFMFQAGIAPYL